MILGAPRPSSTTMNAFLGAAKMADTAVAPPRFNAELATPCASLTTTDTLVMGAAAHEDAREAARAVTAASLGASCVGFRAQSRVVEASRVARSRTCKVSGGVGGSLCEQTTTATHTW